MPAELGLKGHLLVFIVGLLVPLMLPVLPGMGWILVSAAIALPLGLLGGWRRLPAVFVLGFVWAVLWHGQAVDKRLDPALDQQQIWIEGKISGLPEATETGWRFMLDQARVIESGTSLPLMRVHWYGGEPVQQGELWRLQARLRLPRGMSNPGGFDYESWLYAKGIGALASVRQAERLAAADSTSLDNLRARVRAELESALQGRRGGLRLIALVVGDRGVLSREDWLVLQSTGTSHLMVISGLHVGMVAAAVFLLVSLFGRSGLISLPWPRLWLAAPLSILAAAIYAGLAGFAVATQRALLMVSLVLLARLLYRQPSPWFYWLMAFALVVLVNPAAPLLAGFWLSFVAVGLLIFGMSGRLLQRGVWWRWGRAQWVVFLGLWPWLMLWGMPASQTAPLINLIAIPWVGLLVVPAALLGTLLHLALDQSWLLWLAAESLYWLFFALEWAAELRAPQLLAFPGWINWLLGSLGVLALLSPLSRLLWLPALLCLLALAANPAPRPGNGQLWVTVLDVGQGLSVLLQTREYDVLYDAGARLSSGFDLGEAVVHPALLALGVRKLDLLMVSHADNDHAGGAPAIKYHLPVGRVLAGQHEVLDARLQASACQPGERWEWNGIPFEILYSAPSPAPANERSCVLRAGKIGAGVLLPGDLGIRGEYQMLDKDLRAELLLAPHHGSRSSSSYAFIRAVDPRWVVFSAGQGNRYGHPHPKVVERYRELAVEPVYTSRSGALRFILDDQGSSRLDWVWRQRARRFWHE